MLDIRRHLLVGDFVKHWEVADQRARLARMFDPDKMRGAAFTLKDEQNPTLRRVLQ